MPDEEFTAIIDQADRPVWTKEQVRAEAEAFLQVCVRAARAIIQLDDMRLAEELLIDAIIVADEYHRRMQELIIREPLRHAPAGGGIGLA